MQVQELSAYELQLHKARKARLARFASRAIKPPKIVPIIEPEPDPVPIQVRTVTPVQAAPAASPALPAEPTEPSRPTLDQIMREVASRYGLTRNDLKSASRIVALTIPRREYCYRAMVETLKSMSEIGRALGGRDHTTVIHAVRQWCLVNDLPLPRGARWGKKKRHDTLIQWTAEMVDQLRELRGHMTIPEIAATIGVSEDSVIRARRQFKMRDVDCPR